MRKLLASLALAVLALGLATFAASALPRCPPGTVRICAWQKTSREAPAKGGCKCVPEKKNVPPVRPNKSPGLNK